MAMSVSEISEWLNDLDVNTSIGIDDGGLCLCVVGNESIYLAVGGITDDYEEDEEG